MSDEGDIGSEDVEGRLGVKGRYDIVDQCDGIEEE